MPERDDAFFEALVTSLSNNIGDSVRSALAGVSQKSGGDGKKQMAGGRQIMSLDSKSIKDIGVAVVGEMVSRKTDLESIFGGGGGKGKGGKGSKPGDGDKKDDDPGTARLIKAWLIQNKTARAAGDALKDTIKYGNAIARSAAVTNNMQLRSSKTMTREMERFGLGLPEMGEAFNNAMRAGVGKIDKSVVAMNVRSKGHGADVALQNKFLAQQTQALGRSKDSTLALNNQFLDLAHSNDMLADSITEAALAMIGLSKKQNTIFDPAVGAEFTEAAAKLSTTFKGTRNEDINSFLTTIGQGDRKGIQDARRLGTLLEFDETLIETNQKEYIVQAATATARYMDAGKGLGKDERASRMAVLNDAGMSSQAAEAMQQAVAKEGGEAKLREMLNETFTPAESMATDVAIQENIMKTSNEANDMYMKTAIALESLDMAMGLVGAKAKAVSTVLEDELIRSIFITSSQILGFGSLVAEMIHGAKPGTKSTGGSGFIDTIVKGVILKKGWDMVKGGAKKLNPFSRGARPVPPAGAPTGSKWNPKARKGTGQWETPDGKPVKGPGSRSRGGSPAAPKSGGGTKFREPKAPRGFGPKSLVKRILFGIGLYKAVDWATGNEAQDPRESTALPPTTEDLESSVHPEMVDRDGKPLSEKGSDRGNPVYVEEVRRATVERGVDDLGRSTTVTESVDAKGSRTRVTKTEEDSFVDLSTGPGGVPTGVNSLEELTKHIRMAESTYAKHIEREQRLTPGSRMESHSQDTGRMRQATLDQAKSQYDAKGGEQSVIESLTDNVTGARTALSHMELRGPRTASQESLRGWEDSVYSLRDVLAQEKAALEQARPNVTNAQELDKLAIFDHQMRQMDRVDAVDPNDPNMKGGVVGELPWEQTEEERNYGKFLPKDKLPPRIPPPTTEELETSQLPAHPADYVYPGINIAEAGVKTREAAKTAKLAKVVQSAGKKSVLKKLPIVAPLIGIWQALERWGEGDILGGMGELASGVLGGMVHPAALVASATIDASLAARDIATISGDVDEEERNAKEKDVGRGIALDMALNPTGMMGGPGVGLLHKVIDGGIALGVALKEGKVPNRAELDNAKSDIIESVPMMEKVFDQKGAGAEMIEYLKFMMEDSTKTKEIEERKLELAESTAAFNEISAAEAVETRSDRDRKEGSPPLYSEKPLEIDSMWSDSFAAIGDAGR